MKIEMKILLLISAIAFVILATSPPQSSLWLNLGRIVGLMIVTGLTVYFFSDNTTQDNPAQDNPAQPLQQLTAWVNEISEHNYRHSKDLTDLATRHPLILPILQRQDEIGELARSLQRMEEALSQAIENLQNAAIDKERMESELRIGRAIQMDMLMLDAAAFPKRKDLAMYAILEPAREVCGDFYDVYFIREQLSYLLEEHRFCFCIGDASGKGVPAALFAAVIKTLIKSQAYIDLSPANIVTNVNQVLSVNNPSCMFVTLFLGILNLMNGELVYINAGHNAPYLRHSDGSLEMLNQRHGPAIGILEDLTYRESRITLKTGDMLIAYTDGVTEAMDREQNLFSDERFMTLLQSGNYQSPETAIALIKETIEDFRGEAEQSDDLTIVSLQFLGEPSEVGELAEFSVNSDALSRFREQWQ